MLVQWLHFHRDMREVRTNYVKCIFKIVNANSFIGFTCNKQNMIISIRFDHIYFIKELFICKSYPSYFVVKTKSTIGTNVLTFIGKIHGDIHLNDLPKSFLRELMA